MMGAQKKSVCVCVCFVKIVGSQRVLHIQLKLIHVYGKRDSYTNNTGTCVFVSFVCGAIIIYVPPVF